MNPKNYKEGTVTVIRKEYSPIRDGNVFMGEVKYVVQNIVARSNEKIKTKIGIELQRPSNIFNNWCQAMNRDVLFEIY